VIAIIVTVVDVTGLIINGLRLRARVPTALPATGAGQPGADWMWMTAQGVAPDDATRREAAAYALAEGLGMLELVPGDLPATAARDLVRMVDPRVQRADRLAVGRGNGAALLIARPVSERAGAQASHELESADVVAVLRRVRPYSRRGGTAIAAAAGLRSSGDDLTRRRARLRANGVIVPVHLALDAVPYILTMIALLAGWEWGLGAAAAYCLQPYLIFLGTAMRPRGLHRTAILRPVHAPYVLARTLAGRWRSAAELRRDAEFAAAVPYYRTALAAGTGRFFEERRPDCPWCGSADLTVLVRSPDLVFGKPGTFTLERCGGCGHVFQNPRLSPEGLGFYYRDAYDGFCAADAEDVFASGIASYLGRARMLEPFTTPKAWLDVGAGHGHFCAVASETWPATVFDGLDQGAGIADAEERGWIATGYRGEFRDLAGALAGRYDVISMHHYLEHTRDPLAEIDTAARVLPPGGHLLIELPDPQWPLARIFGPYWMPWFQPQHQHMMPLGNLTAALAERGLQPVAIERGLAHQENDFAIAWALMLMRIAPFRTLPWSAGMPTAAAKAWRTMAWTAGGPVLVASALLDRTLCRGLARRWDRGNAYRVLARREDITANDH
jgi:SAM-dependent methyltransferase